jgi:hypothetical protein
MHLQQSPLASRWGSRGGKAPKNKAIGGKKELYVIVCIFIELNICYIQILRRSTPAVINESISCAANNEFKPTIIYYI